LPRPTDRSLEPQTIESDGPDLFGDAPKPVPAPVAANLPVPVARPRHGRRRGVAIVLLVALIAAGSGGFYWWKSVQSQLPAGIFAGNGRIEADPIDIATKFPGRIAALLADQGDMVKAGQVVARMDTRDLERR
jgi:HlyD family secretion protein